MVLGLGENPPNPGWLYLVCLSSATTRGTSLLYRFSWDVLLAGDVAAGAVAAGALRAAGDGRRLPFAERLR